MCGITGLFCSSGINDLISAFQRANTVAQHRGPDGRGFALFDTHQGKDTRWLSYKSSVEIPDMPGATLALGHRRLAIIDLSETGAQPMANEDDSLWITYNGEIYNYVELRVELERAGHIFRSQSDTEVIIHAYEEWGEGCVTNFNGIWAFAIADLKNRKLFCSRDRFGVKPFHYYSDGGHFVFGSEIKQLLCFPFLSRKVNEQIIYDFLAYAALDHCAETFFEGIHKLLQGHNLILDLNTGSVIIKPYYQPSMQLNNDISFQEAAQEFRRLFTDSVRLQLRSDVEVGSCLSGGLDSSSIVCLMNQHLKREGKNTIQRTFSSHFESEEANELEYMQEVIKATNVRADFTYPQADELLRDMERLVWSQEEPFGSTSIFAQWSVYKLVHEHGIKVMLDGQGADEQLAGYLGLSSYYFKELQAKRSFFQLIYERWKYARFQQEAWLPLISRYLVRNQPSLPPPTSWINPQLIKQYQMTSPYLANLQVIPFGKKEHLNNVLYQLTFLGNLQQLLRYEDRNSMAFSVEARVPFLDHRLVEFIFSLPSEFKIRSGRTKRVLRDGMAGILPEKIRHRSGKLGFSTPERLWQRTALRPLIEQAINDENISHYIVPKQAMLFLEQMERHNLHDFSPWRWLNLSIWIKQYELAS